MTKPTDHIGPSVKAPITDLQLMLLCLANPPEGTDKAQVARLRKRLSRIGALEALDRLYEENYEGLRRLAQEEDL